MKWISTASAYTATGIRRAGVDKGAFIVAVIIITLSVVLIFPVALILLLSFNTAPLFFAGEKIWGLDNWREAFSQIHIYRALFNTIWLWFAGAAISFPFAVVTAWLLARTRIPHSHTLEFLFWVAYVTPGGLIAWILLFDPTLGYVNIALTMLPFIDESPFNIFSVPGILFVTVMGSGVSLKVMLLTPAFRNMDAALEEAARIGGASNIRTMLRVTIPLMTSPIVLVFALQLMRMFQSFESELILGRPIGFFVYSTLIFDQVRMQEPPAYGQATAAASLTMVVVAFIIPLQRWVLKRRRYTTITGNFRPGLIDLDQWKWPAFGMILFFHVATTFLPLVVMGAGSFMVRSGYFELDPLLTTDHWKLVLTHPRFIGALRTTVLLATTTAIISPILFSLIAYIVVRTAWRFRYVLDSLIWVSAAIPGMLTGLGLLLVVLWTPGLNLLYGTIWILIIVIVIQGNTTGVNISKAAIVQIGFDMEEAGRVSGAGWLRTYIRIWIPLLLPTLALLAMMNFTIAAGTTSSIILLASRETTTMSILILQLLLPEEGSREAAAAAQIVLGVLTLTLAIIARRYGIRLGVRHG